MYVEMRDEKRYGEMSWERWYDPRATEGEAAIYTQEDSLSQSKRGDDLDAAISLLSVEWEEKEVSTVELE